ncbi:MAG: DUF454 family protein [Bacteroidales bacterium]|nr:MAG: DUF454 family protein [Bacteroidales bacterium]
MINLHPSPIIRAFLLLLGILALVLGVIGIFIPLLPTTPFLLLASYSFARSNKKFNDWLLTNRFFGKHLQDYLKSKTVKREIKWISIGILWFTILITILVINAPLFVEFMLIAVAIGVTIHLYTLNGAK